MYSTVENEKYGIIKYNESFWTGKKELNINGKTFFKIAKNKYSYGQGDDLITAEIKGNMLTGVNILIDNDEIEVVRKTKVYEYILAFIPFVIICIWGNSQSLCSIFPLVGGAIGGAISGGVSFTALILMKKQKSFIATLLVSLISLVVTVLSCYLIAVMILSIVK